MRSSRFYVPLQVRYADGIVFWEDAMVEGIISAQQAGNGVAVKTTRRKKIPVVIRVDREMLTRIDRAAKRFGLSRSGFIVSGTAVRLETVEEERG
jgi:hypothetical protein